MLKKLVGLITKGLNWLVETGEKLTGWQTTFDVVVSLVIIVWLLSGLLNILSFFSFANLMILAVIVGVLGIVFWFVKTFGKD